MTTEFESLVQKLNKAGHDEIATALRKGQVGTLNGRQRMILADASICLKMVRRSSDLRRLKGAMVEVTTSGWGREPELTEPGVIQPLMSL
ncbi:MAG: hypothetical protein OQK12_06545 [Motiliproteus sp.]|nr:hypothetical protein [Motiliproteus sp.]MCW9053238.1 hypothetical protein [Motiliproteus sp.]